MKKRSLQLSIMSVLALLLLGGGIASFSHQAKTSTSDESSSNEETSQASGERFYSDTDDQITNISYTYENEKIQLTLKNGTWENKESKDFPLDEDKVSAMASALYNLTYYDHIPKDTSDLSDYGLEKPSLTVTFQWGNKENASISFGDINAVTGYQYCLMEGMESIYLVDASVADAISYSRNDLMVYDSLPSYASTDVTKLTIQTKNNTYKCTYSDTGSNQQYTTYPWQEISTKTDIALDTNSFSSYLSSISSLSIDCCIDYAPTKATLKKYGLSNADSCKLTIYYQIEQEKDDSSADSDDSEKNQEPVYEKYKYHITIGDDYDKKYSYMSFSLSDYVYLIDKETADILRGFTTSAYEPLDVCLIPLDTIDTLDVSFGGKDKFTISRGSVTTTDDYGSQTVSYLYYKDKKEIDNDSFETLYDTFTSMKAEKRIQETDISGETPVLELYFHRNTDDFSEMTLKFYPYDANYYLVEFNGHTNLLVNRVDLENHI